MIGKYAAFIFLLALAGCVHEPIEPTPSHVTDVRKDLRGINDQAIGALVQEYLHKGKVFLYASQLTDSPAVDKTEITFASQFKIAPIYDGFQEAALFNQYMLGYIRGQLRKNICPEHPGVKLVDKIIKEKKVITRRKGKFSVNALKNSGQRGTTSVTVFVKKKVLVCPVDGRTFVLIEPVKKSGENKMQDPATR